MSSFTLDISASAVYLVDAPTLEVYVDGSLVGSFSVTSLLPASPTTQSFTINYAGTHIFPDSMEFRFTDASMEASRSVTISDVSINSVSVDTGRLTDLVLNHSEASFLTTTPIDFSPDGTPPTAGSLGTPTITGTGSAETLLGTDGADVIDAGAGDDRIRGLGDDDAIIGGDGADTIFGEAGNDTVIGEAGADTIFGNDGDDQLYGQADNDTIIGGAGDDLLNGGTGDDYLIGDAGHDLIFGEDGADTVVGLDGNDILFGDGGADLIAGGTGNDYAYGGADNDTIVGEAGDDTLFGDGGDDFIYGGADDDVIDGGAGADDLWGGAGDDDISGDAGADMIHGGAGADTLNGGADNDIISGGDGADTINGDAGDDILQGHGLSATEISDILAANANVFYSEASNSFYEFVDTGSNITYAAASTAAAARTISSTAGHLAAITTSAEWTDILAEYDGVTSSWIAGADIDKEGIWKWTEGAETGATYYTQSTSTTANNFYDDWDPGQPNGANEQPGQDFAYILESTDQWADAYIDPWSVNASFVAIEGYLVEWEAGSISDDNSADTLNGGAGDDTLYGFGGDDTLNGDGDDDLLFGGDGDDELNGGDGADVLLGQDGEDTLNGGAGADILDDRGDEIYADITSGTLNAYGNGQDGTGTITYIGDGTGVNLSGNRWRDIDLDYTVTANTVLEFEFKSSDEAEIHGIGFDSDENISSTLTFKVYGSQAWGLSAFDNYDGSGSWTQYSIDVGSYYTGSYTKLFFVNDGDSNTGNGSFRNVRIYESGTGDGGDTFNGGTGADTLYGGLGADTFEFSSTDAVDTLYNFHADEGDIIDISDILTSTNQAIANYVTITDSGDDAILAIDADGSTGGSSYTNTVTLIGQAGLSVSTLYTDGNLVIV